MTNKIAMVNKELHGRLFEEPDHLDQEEQEERERHYNKHQLPPQLILKNMIKKGLTNTQPINSRPKTALSNFKRTTETRQTFSRLKSIENAHLPKPIPYKRNDLISQNNVEFDFNTTHPKEFDEFGLLLSKLKIQREQENLRKKIKLDKYGDKKFRYAWRKCNIPQ